MLVCLAFVLSSVCLSSVCSGTKLWYDRDIAAMFNDSFFYFHVSISYIEFETSVPYFLIGFVGDLDPVAGQIAQPHETAGPHVNQPFPVVYPKKSTNAFQML